jgi:carbamoyltransferase
MGMWVLGISAFYHDAAAALLRNGEIIAAAQEERFTRKKHDPSFPRNSIRWCLEYAGISLDRIEALAFYEKPFLKFERLLETYYAFAPRGLRSFCTAMPVWIKEKIFMKYIIKKEIEDVTGMTFPRNIKMVFPDHHLSHGASAFYPSPFREAAILTIDGVGEWATSTVGYGREKDIRLLKEIHFPHSLGLFYSAFTYYAGFKVNSGEYKLMGLAPYGNPYADRTRKYLSAIYDELIDIKEDGSLWLNMEYFDYTTGLRMVKEDAWQRLFDILPRKPEEEITQEYMDLAYAVQKVTEDVVLKMVQHAKTVTGCRYLTMAGGVAFNCVVNGKILKRNLFEDIWIQPAAGDAGGALGAAYVAWYLYLNRPRELDICDSMKGCYLGPEYSASDIERMITKFNTKAKKFDCFEDLADTVARLISDGNVIGWFQGKMEWGPRALGNRTIIADARDKTMQKKLNLKIKFRESFRPFAPSVLFEDVSEYFEIDMASPYMLLVADVIDFRKNKVSDVKAFYQLDLKERLDYARSDIPAVTHVDYSARIQTVHENTNPKFYGLIKAFKKLTGYGVIINTSFNVRGEPIVMTPEQAFICFMRTDMDYLVIEDFLFNKKEQPVWVEDKNWEKEYELD